MTRGISSPRYVAFSQEVTFPQNVTLALHVRMRNLLFTTVCIILYNAGITRHKISISNRHGAAN